MHCFIKDKHQTVDAASISQRQAFWLVLILFYCANNRKRLLDIQKWSVKAAFDEIECENPSHNARQNLQELNDSIKETVESNDSTKSKAAEDLLKRWKGIKKMLIPKNNKGGPTFNNNISNSTGNIYLFQSNQSPVHISHHAESSTSAAAAEPNDSLLGKRTNDDRDGNNSSNDGCSWDSREKHKNKRKYMNAYLGSYYGNTDFGGGGSDWKVNDIDVTGTLKSFREKSVEGAQFRKYLGDARVLSLSYIFLISPIDNCAILKLAPQQQQQVMKSLDVHKHLNPLAMDAMIACREIQQTIAYSDMDEQEIEDSVNRIKVNSLNNDVKTATRIISALLITFQNKCNSNNFRRGEADLIIDTIRPYLINCLVNPLSGIKFAWMTYQMIHPSDNQTMIPDFVLFVEPSSGIKFEVFFAEVKRKGNFQNNHLENDLIKLGKEMHTALNKLVVRKIINPEIFGLLIEDTTAIAYKMDLEYNGQYRMIEISRFNFARDLADDILLIPAIMEKLFQLKNMVQATINSIVTPSFDVCLYF